MIRKYFTFAVFCMLISGCATSRAIPYDQINFTDEVNKSEALAVALKDLINYPESGKFVQTGQVIQNKRIECLSSHWLIMFKQKNFSMIDYYYFVIVDKHNGQVVRSSEVFPKSNYWAMMVHDIDGC